MKNKQSHKIKINDIEVEYSVEYRKVKYTRYEFKKTENQFRFCNGFGQYGSCLHE